MYKLFYSGPEKSNSYVFFGHIFENMNALHDYQCFSNTWQYHHETTCSML